MSKPIILSGSNPFTKKQKNTKSQPTIVTQEGYGIAQMEAEDALKNSEQAAQPQQAKQSKYASFLAAKDPINIEDLI